jgi:hypothetical protein
LESAIYSALVRKLLNRAEPDKLETMKKLRSLFLLLLLLFPFGAIALGQGEVPTGWEPIAEGIDFQQYRLTSPAPVNVFVARMQRADPGVTIESSIAQGRLSGGTETVSGMASRYDGALNFWGEPTLPVSPTWGSTNDVIVAINGFYYGADVEPPGVPWSGQVHSSWYAKRFDDLESSSGFIWNSDRSAFIGGCISHPVDKQFIDFENGNVQYIDGINVERGDNQLILYTPQFDRDTNTDSSGVEVLVEMEVPARIAVSGNAPLGIIRSVLDNHGSTPIPYDHIVLSAEGSAATALRVNAVENTEISIAQRVKDCTSEPTTNDWTKAYAGVGGHWRFLRDSKIYDYSGDPQADARDPRTAIAYNAEYVFFIVADGRNPDVSVGMTVAEMADFAKYTLGATDAIMQDGGGSSTMVINGQVVNNTFCNNVYCTSKIYLPLVINSADGEQITEQPTPEVMSEPTVEWDAELQILQRLVANGMLMVRVLPKEISTQPYDPGDPITAFTDVNVYLGPGTNYAILGTANGNGNISAQPLNDLGGVFAKGQYWWKVDFNDVEGWVPETSIIPQLKLRTTINDLKAR